MQPAPRSGALEVHIAKTPFLVGLIRDTTGTCALDPYTPLYSDFQGICDAERLGPSYANTRVFRFVNRYTSVA